jgi:chemotaxis receptor (MCP) glutamine deamidase CheD
MVARPRALRVVEVLPDRFDVVAHDVVLRADLTSAIAVCLYDSVQEAGALVHLRVVPIHGGLLDATDSTRASELLLLDRCVASLRTVSPAARNLQARIAAALPEDRATLESGSDILDVLAEFFAYAGIQHTTPDVTASAGRRVSFRPWMGQIEIRDSASVAAALPIAG